MAPGRAPPPAHSESTIRRAPSAGAQPGRAVGSTRSRIAATVGTDEHGEAIPSLEGEARFSEMALYVLVHRDGDCWLAAGQNTIVIADSPRAAAPPK